jgi:16S rRNA (uracil1498-N3)-methyltransferase
MAHRFFVSPESIALDQVTFGSAAAHQLRHVLRLGPAARVVVLDDSGWEYEVELTHLGRDTATGRICASRMPGTEPRLSLTLYQGVLKGHRFEWVLQKGTELGVSRFVPLVSERAVTADAGQIEGKRTRWEQIIREAAEQSHRGRLPRLAPPLSFPLACQQGPKDHDESFIPWEEAMQVSLSAALRALECRPQSVALWIGPEGGFTSAEVALAQERGIRAVTLGPRILRAETAGLAAATIVLSILGEMEGSPPL